MSGHNKYKCVNCGATAAALYKTYGPSVLKLTKCVSKTTSFNIKLYIL